MYPTSDNTRGKYCRLGPGIESRWGARFSAPVQTGPGAPPSLLYNGYRVFPEGKAAGAWRWPSTPSSAEVKERIELYLYSPSGSSRPVTGWTLPLPLPFLSLDRKIKTRFCNRNACLSLERVLIQFATLLPLWCTRNTMKRLFSCQGAV